jgi:hypothetical protein
MPWEAEDAPAHTRKASTAALRQLWAKVANDRRGRGATDAEAIRQANAVVAREAGESGEAEPNARGTPAARASRWL